MPFNVPTYAQIRDRYLQAVVNQRPAAAVGPDSDNFVRASAIAAVLEGVYAHQAWVLRQAFPDLADADFLEKMANQRGIRRRAPVGAAGTVRFTGSEGINIPVGQQVFTAAGNYYTVTEALLIGAGGTVDVPASAVVPGAGGNLAGTSAATVSEPAAGIEPTCTVLTMTGGTDLETDEALLERLLLRLSEEAQGGNAADYRRWALEVSGVDRVYVFDARRGAGTVDVVPMPVSGLPSSPMLAAVQEIIDARRPVGMRPTLGVVAQLPTAVTVSIAAELSLAAGYTLEAVQAQVESSIDSVFSALGPGQALVRNQLVSAVMAVPGVTDVTLYAPSGNVTSSVDADSLEIILRGALTLS